MVVKIGDTVHCVDHKKYNVGLLDGKLYLLVDFGFEYIL